MTKVSFTFAVRIAFTSIFLFCLNLSDAYASVGTIPGEFKVNNDGSAGYTIPIQVPSGINGIQPNLALVYNSNAGNGMLGVGWNLSGLSSITRCSASMADDGYIRGIKYDANDRFCLDGQKLVLASGAYGASGSTYRTQKESWKTITAIGNVGSGLGYFEVKTKDNKTLQYGATPDSLIEPQGRSDLARTWAISRIEDENGNYLTITYDEDQVNGQYYPISISYAQGQALVSFQFVSRSDAEIYYQNGSVLKFNKVLKSITS